MNPTKLRQLLKAATDQGFRAFETCVAEGTLPRGLDEDRNAIVVGHILQALDAAGLRITKQPRKRVTGWGVRGLER